MLFLALVRISGGSGRESITVLATIAADGSHLPPLIVFKGKGVQVRWTSSNAYPGTLYTCSSNGWMEEPQFFEWFSSNFVKHVDNLRSNLNLPNQPAILMFDGHNSHISYRIVKCAIENHIHLVKFPSHLTDKIQPLDKCVFGPVKTIWEKKLIKFGKEQLEKKDTGRLPKGKFVELLGEVWIESMKPQNIIKGFSSTGTFPVDSSKFPESELNTIALIKYKQKLEKLHSGPIENITQPSTSNQVVLPSPICNSAENCGVVSYQVVSPVSSPLPDSLPVPSPNCNVITQTSSKCTPTKIIEIFSNVISRGQSSTFTDKVKRQIVPRLKPVKYGEILTTEAVLEKLKDAESLKRKKEEMKEEKRDKKAKIYKKTLPPQISPDTDIELCQDSSDDENLEELIIAESIPEIEYLQPEWIQLKLGGFLLVNFMGGKRNTVNYKYVCCITDIDQETGEITVSGYRRYDKFATEFVLQEKDVSTIDFKMIVAVLPEPDIKEKDRHIVYAFPGSVNVFEK